jgi:hypothetical protein
MATTPGLGTGLYANSILKEEDLIDDSALDNALSDDDDLLDSINLGDQLSKIESLPPSDVPAREGLYSTPLSWEKPQPGLRMDPLIGIGTPTLSEAEQRRLLAIALNTGTRNPGSFGYSASLDPSYPSSLDSRLATASMSQVSTAAEVYHLPQKLPETPVAEDLETILEAPQGGRPQLQRTNTGMTDKSKDKGKSGDRTAHNDIERKYRTNLKDRISELRDAVPSLRSMSEEGGKDNESSNQNPRAPKVSKVSAIV